MYCPVCFNDTMLLSEKGVVNIVINNVQMNNGRFLFNTAQESEEVILENFKKKADEFFRWYSSFQNWKPIEKVDLVSNNLSCTNRCRLPSATSLSVKDKLIPTAKVLQVIEKLGKKYGIMVHMGSKTYR